jgi:hypothetical protein
VVEQGRSGAVYTCHSEREAFERMMGLKAARPERTLDIVCYHVDVRRIEVDRRRGG